MRRRTWLGGLPLLAFAGLSHPLAQPAPMRRIGMLLPYSEATPERLRASDAFRDGLRELGWAEGRSLVIEVRMAGIDPQHQREAAAELRALPVEVIVALGTITIRAARDGAPDVPIVMVNAGDPVGAGLAVSLARPGGRLTGTSAAGEEVLAKQVELLVAAAPHLGRIAALMNSANPANGFFLNAMLQRAKALGLRMDRIEVATAAELDAAVGRAKGAGLVVVGDPMFFLRRARIIEVALRHGVPTICGGRDYVAAGALMSYLSDQRWHWRSAAGFVDKILRGARPGELPIEQPTAFELVINLRTARALGITIAPSLRLRASEVIE